MAYSKEKGMLKAQEAMAEAGLTEEQKQQAIAEYLAAQGMDSGESAEAEAETKAEVEAKPSEEDEDA
jgi:uncharacterized protein YoaH (UPF0181 family)